MIGGRTFLSADPLKSAPRHLRGGCRPSGRTINQGWASGPFGLAQL